MRRLSRWRSCASIACCCMAGWVACSGNECFWRENGHRSNRSLAPTITLRVKCCSHWSCDSSVKVRRRRSLRIRSAPSPVRYGSSCHPVTKLRSDPTHPHISRVGSCRVLRSTQHTGCGHEGAGTPDYLQTLNSAAYQYSLGAMSQPLWVRTHGNSVHIVFYWRDDKGARDTTRCKAA